MYKSERNSHGKKQVESLTAKLAKTIEKVNGGKKSFQFDVFIEVTPLSLSPRGYL